jgi:hypothetical protein
MPNKSATKKKLCWNCEGNVSQQQENCPFCGVYLSPLNESAKDSLFAPPYKMAETHSENGEIPEAPYADKEANQQPQINSDEAISESKEEEKPNILLPLLLMPAGTVLFLFGLVMFFFSRNGVLTLRWDGTYWFLYLFLGVPLIIYGWRCLLKVQDDS